MTTTSEEADRTAALDLLEEVLALTEPYKECMDPGDVRQWSRISAEAADLREGPQEPATGYEPSPRPPGSPPIWQVTVVQKLSRRMSEDEIAEVAVEAESAEAAEALVRSLCKEGTTEDFEELFEELDSDCVGCDEIDSPSVGGFAWEDEKIATVRLPDDHPVHLRASDYEWDDDEEG